MGFSRQEYWSGLPCPPPGDLPDSAIEPTSPASSALQVDSLPLSHQGNPQLLHGGLVTYSRPILCDPMDFHLPSSSVHGIFQARILEWVIMGYHFLFQGNSPTQGLNPSPLQAFSCTAGILYQISQQGSPYSLHTQFQFSMKCGL